MGGRIPVLGGSSIYVPRLRGAKERTRPSLASEAVTDPPQPFDTHFIFSLVLIPAILLLEKRRRSRKGVTAGDRLCEYKLKYGVRDYIPINS